MDPLCGGSQGPAGALSPELHPKGSAHTKASYLFPLPSPWPPVPAGLAHCPSFLLPHHCSTLTTVCLLGCKQDTQDTSQRLGSPGHLPTSPKLISAMPLDLCAVTTDSPAPGPLHMPTPCPTLPGQHCFSSFSQMPLSLASPHASEPGSSPAIVLVMTPGYLAGQQAKGIRAELNWVICQLCTLG